MEGHAEQDVKMVLMHVGQYSLADGGECVFVVGQKDCLNETGAMSYPAGWDNCTRRTWCNGDYKNSLPGSLMSIFKEMKTVIDHDSSGAVSVNDYFALPAEREIFGVNSNASAASEQDLFQIDFYKSPANRIKSSLSSASHTMQPNDYWGRSYVAGMSDNWVVVTSAGASSFRGSSSQSGIAPFGCIGKKVV